eukprot:scaffold248355_cov50-Cyclotella_meneghiniana.AAC.5
MTLDSRPNFFRGCSISIRWYRRLCTQTAYCIASGHKSISFRPGQRMAAWIMLALAIFDTVWMPHSATPFWNLAPTPENVSF